MPLTAQERLTAIVESSFDAIMGKDLNSVITDWNPAAERMFGYSAEEAIGQSILMIIPEGLRDQEIDIIGKIRRGEKVGTFDTTRQRKDGALIFVSLTISPIKDDTGRVVGASKIARDITATKESERRIRTLLREVNHRVKNQFAVILSVIRETANRTENHQDFIERVRERITSLSRTHDLLVSSDWEGASIFDLVQEHLKPFGHEERITLSGPLIMLAPSAVQYLGMAVHELGTNSSKYGALSGADGTIQVGWQLNGLGDDQELHFFWDEKSIHETEAGDASRRGYGNVVLQRVTPLALDGKSKLERTPGHTQWSLRAPAKGILLVTAAQVHLLEQDTGGL